MKIIGFNFTKISAERFSDDFKELKINTHIDISSIKKINVSFIQGKQEPIELAFTCTLNYNNNSALIEIKGNMLLSTDKKESKEILDNWENKKIPENIRVFLLNTIFRKSNLKALELEEDLNLPIHIQLPTLSNEKNS